MFDGWERMKHWLQSGDQFFQQMQALWHNGPRAEVYETEDKVKVVIEAPGLMTAAGKHQWAVRVVEQSLMLRGKLHMQQSVRSDYGRTYSERHDEHFTKIIPLPAPVENKPSLIRYDDGLVTIVLKKRKDVTIDEWHPIDLNRRK
ncbi:Hsp20/alpha crystallin family protein [Paenibacillus chartarius]|uniref:Hsp20/alpha crystallin family protein n=1 Tax=Paenibacillus chartarius TaxID=747481 RepID=A0ABV6DID0_9BACL